MKHRFAGEESLDADAVQPSSKPTLTVEHLDAVRPSELVQSRIGRDEVFAEIRQVSGGIESQRHSNRQHQHDEPAEIQPERTDRHRRLLWAQIHVPHSALADLKPRLRRCREGTVTHGQEWRDYTGERKCGREEQWAHWREVVQNTLRQIVDPSCGPARAAARWTSRHGTQNHPETER